MTIKLLVVDDHILVRQGIVKLLNADKDIEVIGEASSGVEALTKAHETSPEIILMDIYMPGLDGLAATRLIADELPDVKVIIFTASSNDTDVLEATRAGARGYVLKSTQVSHLVEQVKRVAAGGVAFSDEMTSKLVTGLASFKPSAPVKASSSPLSQREQEVLDLIAQGNSNKDISVTLEVSQNTVRAHIRSLMQKLHLDNRTQLAVYGLREGFGQRSNGHRAEEAPSRRRTRVRAQQRQDG